MGGARAVLLLAAVFAAAIDADGAAWRVRDPVACRRPLSTSSSRIAAPVLRTQRTQHPAVLQASSSGLQAAGGVGLLALLSEVLQIVNTFIALFVLNRVTGADSVASLVEVFASIFSGLGAYALPAYAALLILITVLPLMSALLFIVLAGTVFGAVKGTLVVSLSLSTAATISTALSRRVAPKLGFTLSKLHPKAAAVDSAIGQGPAQTSFLLVTLLRLSPVLPFTFSNYLAGLTSLPLWTMFLGTMLGTLPTQAVYVGAGALGKQALEGGVKLPRSIIFVGIIATLAAIFIVGRVAQKTLEGMDIVDAGGKP